MATKRFHVYVKYNIAVNRVIVIRIDQEGKKQLLTKTGRWIPSSESVEILDGSVEITDVFRYDPRSSPPD